MNARLDAIHRFGRTERQMEEEVSRLHTMLDELKTFEMEYNDNAVRQMIECIRVYPDDRFEVIFGGGYSVIEHIEVLK